MASDEGQASFEEQAAEIHRKIAAFRAYKKTLRLRNRVFLQAAALIMAGMLLLFHTHGFHHRRHPLGYRHFGHRHL
jgi:hypothetical protein